MKNKEAQKGAKSLNFMVPGAGIEPARPCDREILSLLCLPISPPGQMIELFNCLRCVFQHSQAVFDEALPKKMVDYLNLRSISNLRHQLMIFLASILLFLTCNPTKLSAFYHSQFKHPSKYYWVQPEPQLELANRYEIRQQYKHILALSMRLI